MTLAYALSALSFVLGVPLLVLLIWLALQPIMRHFERSEWPGAERHLHIVVSQPCRWCGAYGWHSEGCSRLDRMDAGEVA